MEPSHVATYPYSIKCSIPSLSIINRGCINKWLQPWFKGLKAYFENRMILVLLKWVRRAKGVNLQEMTSLAANLICWCITLYPLRTTEEWYYRSWATISRLMELGIDSTTKHNKNCRWTNKLQMCFLCSWRLLLFIKLRINQLSKWFDRIHSRSFLDSQHFALNSNDLSTALAWLIRTLIIPDNMNN